MPKDRLPKEGDEAAGAFARAFSKRLETAFRALPKAEITASSTDAEAKVQTLRQALAELSSRTVGVDIDADTALGELAAIRAELEQIDASADIDLRADTSAAIAQIAALQAEVDRFNTDQAERELSDLTARLDALRGRTIGVDLDAGAARAELADIQRQLETLNRTTANPQVRIDSARALADVRTLQAELNDVGGRVAMPRVDVDVSSALANISLVAAALASLPAVTSVAVSVGALGAAFGAAGAGAAGFAAVAVPALGRINDALKQQESAAGGAGGAVKSAAQAAAESAQRAMQLEQAERRVADAKKAARQAEIDLTQARRDARRAIEDLNLSLKDAQLAEEDAALAVEEARQRLAEVNADPNATDLERKRADLSYREAVQRLEDQRVRTKRLQEDTQKANAAGVEGSAQVKAAKEREAKADQALLDAKKQLQLVMLQQKAALEKTGGAAGGAASKMADLSKEERALAKDIKGFQQAYEDWQRSLEGDVFPAISGGIKLVQSQLPRISPLVKTAGKSFLDLEKDAKRALKDPFWDEFLFDLNTAMPGAIEDFGHTAGNVLKGLAGVMDALLPHADGITGALEKASQRFADWGTTLKNNPDFQAFIAYAKENGPKVGEIFSNIATAVGKIADAGGKIGPGVLDVLVTISEKIANLEPGQVQAIAGGIAGIMAAAKLGTTLKLTAFVGLADLLTRMSPGQIQALALAIAGVITAVKGYQTITGITEWWGNLRGGIKGAGDAAGTARGKFAGLKDTLTSGGGMALAITGVVTAAGALDRELSGLNPNMNNLVRHLNDFTKGGAPARDVLDQLQGGLSLLDPRGLEDISSVIERMSSSNWIDQLDTKMGDLANTIGGVVGVSFDHGADRIHILDQAMATMVSSGNAEGAARLFDAITKQARDAGTPIERLKDLFPEYTSAVSNSVEPTKDAAGAISGAGKALDGLQRSLDTFTSSTDFAQMIDSLKGKYDDLRGALRDTNGTLDISKAKTDEQRDAIITAREKFSDYISAVREMAEKQQTLTGRTSDAKKAVLDQVGALLTLAGKSKDAQELVYGLAQKFGITRDQADKARGKIGGVKDALDKLRDKTVKVMADTSQAESAIKTLINKYNGYKIITQVDTKTGRSYTTAVPQRAGGVMAYAAGGVEAYAVGGARRSTPPNVASTPTILYGEGRGREYFIPTDPTYRERSVRFLQQAAGEFGYQLSQPVEPVPSQTTVTTTSTSGAGELRITLDNLEPLTKATDQASRTVASGVADAAGETADAAGQLGSTLESAINELSSQISTLAGSVQSLASSVGSAASTASSGKASAGTPGLVPPSGPTKSSSSSSKGRTGTASGGLKELGSASGDLKKIASAKPVIITPAPMADGGLVTSPTILAGEAGREVIVPVSPGKRGRGLVTLHQAASMLGQTVAPRATTLAPRYAMGGGGGFGQEIRELRRAIAQLAGTAPGRSPGYASQGGAPQVQVTIPNAVIREEADISRLGAEFGFELRARG
ncbi:MAG: hypothetical protein IRY84_07825 [Thermobispora bispora]|nr:hypothetical protein [Thermobispora bispora]